MIQSLINFLLDSPVNYLAVETVRRQLEDAGFRRLDAGDSFASVKAGDKVYVTKNDSSIYAFHIGRKAMSDAGFHIICSHCDSPTFRIKPNAELLRGGMLSLNTELYGGAIMQTWFDRPLSLAGRVIIKGADTMHPETRLVHIRRPLMVIPNLAIHFNRQVNDGVKLSKQKDMLPLMAIGSPLPTSAPRAFASRHERGGALDMLQKDGVLLNLIVDELNQQLLTPHSSLLTTSDILDFDLYLYDTTPACTVGLNNDMISGGRLDDLSMVHASLMAMLMGANEVPETTRVMAVFDNEETGSQTKQGAGSPFLATVLERLVMAQGGPRDDFYRAVDKAFMISADNAHAWHPNYSEKYDPTNHPVLGGGPVIKLNAAQKYATDAMSAAIFAGICRDAGVPCQYFVNHSDIAGGSTLGNILAGSLPLRGVDMGCGVLGMHSIRETASCVDHEYCIKAFREFYRE